MVTSGRIETLLEVDYAVVGCGFLSDGRLAVATRDGQVQVWELALDQALRDADDDRPRGGHALRTVETGSRITDARVGGDAIVVACEDGTVWSWDLTVPRLPIFTDDPSAAVEASLRGR